ncbi:OprO/OprP family phosphate-selective porin [Methylotuvimicrobium sp.]|uniref:OprO/OprP family phosphate-selective porin n=1 Tax=Methylotuvimicrobium sp. TaxID=2822413 RepID=UPI003D652CBD
MANNLKSVVSTCALLFTVLGGHSANATDKDLLDILLANEKITQEQYDYLLGKEKMSEADKQELASNDVKVKLDHKGVQFETVDGDFKFNLAGRIHADASYSSGDGYVKRGTDTHVEANDGTEIRRARMEFLGTFFRDWNFKTQVDFADNDVAIKDLFVNYKGLGFMEVTLGAQKQAFSRELQESSNDMMFMERSLMNTLNGPTVDRAIGLNLSRFGDNYTAQVGIYGETVDPNIENEEADEGWAINSRLTYAPIQEKDKVIHLGVAGNYRVPDAKDEVNDDPVKFSYETSHMSNLKLLDTGNIEDTNNIKMVGLEANALYGPFTVGGEYTHMWLDREGGEGNLDFDGWYTEASWTLTGESRIYKKGKFYHVHPNQDFSFKNGGIGAWELAARYAEADLNDADIVGGQMSNLTIALNWYVNKNIRFMANYDRVLDISDSPVTKADGSEPNNLDTFMMRGQLYF